MDDNNLHDQDIYAWTEQQADALRQLSRLRNDLPRALDLPNLAEEIEDLGISELNAVRSYIRLILVHLIKAISAPEAAPLAHWQEEVVNWQSEVLQRITPAMKTRIDMPRIWQAALRQSGKALKAHGRDLPQGLAGLGAEGDCPVALDDLCSEDFDFERILAGLTDKMSRQFPVVPPPT
jgi:hypothetical protein